VKTRTAFHFERVATNVSSEFVGGSLRRHVRHCHQFFVEHQREKDFNGRFTALQHSADGRNARASHRLPTQAEPTDQIVVAFNITSFEILQQTAALRNHFEQSAPRVVVLLMSFEMLGEFVDASRQERDLHLRRPCVSVVRAVFADNCFLNFFS